MTPPCSSVSIINLEQVKVDWFFLYLAISFPEFLDFMIRRKVPSFISKSHMIWEQGCEFSYYSMKVELR